MVCYMHTEMLQEYDGALRAAHQQGREVKPSAHQSSHGTCIAVPQVAQTPARLLSIDEGRIPFENSPSKLPECQAALVKVRMPNPSKLEH